MYPGQRGRGGHIDLEASRARWPAFADAALAKGFRGVLSSPLAIRSRSMGSLNLYSRHPDPFDGEDERVAGIFATRASVVLNNATALSTSEIINDQLREALATRDLIGQAKGMLMMTEGCSADQAFDILRRASQAANRKLRDVARDIVSRTGSDGKFTP